MRAPGRFPSFTGILALALVACSGKPGTGGLEVIVDLQPGLISRCVKVTATDGTTTKETKPMVVGTKTSLQVAIYSDGFNDSVTVQALGYVDAECTMLSGEVSESADGTFGNPAKSLTLTLTPTGNGDGGFKPDAGLDGGRDAGVDAGVDAGADAGIDNDNDGSPLPADCDDTNPAIYPGAAEVCDNALDDDCDSLSDCQETGCNLLRCSPTSFCMNNVCTGAMESPCNDGLDNNNNGLIDCADPDCTPGSMCSDSNSCTTGDVCAADGGCRKTGDVMCTNPPNGGVCYGAAGLCLPDAGASCQYTALTGGTCNDLLGCTTGDTCTAGSCAGTQLVCPLPSNACLSPVGTCQEPSGTCLNPARPAGTGTCNDGVNCTINDTCDGDGGCAGTMVSCPRPSQCHTASTGCDADGGCLYNNRNGGPCDAGAGLGAATCDLSFNCNLTPTSAFPYVPSNFTDTDLPNDGGVALAISTNRTLNTTGTPTLSGTTMPPYTIITPAGGEPTVLIQVTGLTVSSGVALTITGPRPVIFAVIGNVLIDGAIYARNAGAPTGCGNGGNGGAVMGAGGGGGAGFGSAGAVGGVRSTGGAGTLGAVNGLDTLVPIRGGCRGGNGSGTGGTGGAGGGAIQISASGTLAVTSSGVVSASGLGGAGATGTDASGGGGGSGGGVLLEAQTVQLDSGSWLTAHGGGGGGGEDGGDGVAGGNGSDNTTTAAPGGTASNNAGAGGRGATRTTTVQPGNPTTDNDGAGGGGAGMGRIRVNASGTCTIDLAANSSPTAVRSCP